MSMASRRNEWARDMIGEDQIERVKKEIRAALLAAGYNVSFDLIVGAPFLGVSRVEATITIGQVPSQTGATS